MNLKIGGSNVGKIMYGGQEFGGATKLEPGTILYISEQGAKDLKNLHLLSTTKKWENLNNINIEFLPIKTQITPTEQITPTYDNSFDIPSDDFKSLDTGKKYDVSYSISMTVSRSIVDGEYRLNISGYTPIYTIIIRAI